MREPVASTTASNELAQLVGGDVDADVDAAAHLDALVDELLHAALTTCFSILKSGTPKRTSPPPASSRSKSVTA